MHEAQLHQENAFLTLTYDEAHLPPGRSLYYRHYQLFQKRLRRANPKKKIRFYMCGEYGEQFDRPHYHSCLFGHDFPDKVYHAKTGSGSKIYTSAQLSALWPHGFSSIGSVNFESAAYVARYITKKITGDLAPSHYRYIDAETGETTERTPEFNHMSLKPGIGANWLKKYRSDVYPSGEVVMNGRTMRAPRYYDRDYKNHDQLAYEQLQYGRHLETIAHAADNTYDRLKAKEIVTTARMGLNQRKIK